MIPFLEAHGLTNVGTVHYALPTSALYEAVVRRGEGVIGHLGPLIVRTGHHTGRSPKDKFIVREPTSEEHIWWGDVNVPMSLENYKGLRQRMLAYLQGKELFVQDVYAGADRDYRTCIRIISQYAWHSIFARNLFILPSDEELNGFNPEWVVIHGPGFHATPEVDGTNSEAFIVVNFGEKTIMIGGTNYGGEIKKSIFTILNYVLPSARVLSMHCSANIGPEGDSALFFGLSGTGKTTLSADPSRSLIGDDEHGWGVDGIFNFEGGCYAKVIRLNKRSEPEIYATTRRFGTLLENVMVDSKTRRLDLDDDTLTENTRAAYPITHMPSAKLDGLGPHPKNVLMLTCDAFGIMPPISKLTPEQAVYHFLCGYTAKVAGTERGIYGSASLGLRPVASRQDPPARQHLLAREHRLAGRPLRRGPPDLYRAHPRYRSRLPEWLAREGGLQASSDPRAAGAQGVPRRAERGARRRRRLGQPRGVPRAHRGPDGTVP